VIEAGVPAELRGARLDRFLSTLADVGSRSVAERLVADGKVEVDGVVRHKSFRVLPGMQVRVDVEPAAPVVPEQDDSVPFSIVYADDAIIVVDKPAGVVVHPTPGRTTGTLVHALVTAGATGGDDPLRPGIVHRLDRETSGLLVVTRSAEAFAVLGRAMRRRAVERNYTALVHGRPAARAGRIEAPVGREPGRARMTVGGATPRVAVTHFAVAELLPDTTLLDVRLGTGRTHQIRVHLEAIGHPVVGDPVYCPSSAERYGLTRQFLHACRLSFAHPVTAEPMVFTSPLPDDLERALQRARRG
jgi:23S rRNA pseudouridine1911/1915/1917 synthase